MFKMTSFLLSSFLLICTSLFGQLNTTALMQQKALGFPLKEAIIIPMPTDELQQRWKLGHDAVLPDSLIFEWIPKNEDIDNWSELLSIQYFRFNGDVKSQTASEFVQRFLKLINKQFPGVTSTIFKESPDDVSLEWIISNTKQGQPAQEELVRVITTKEGLSRLAYTKKGSDLSQSERNKWLKYLMDAKVVPFQSQ